MNPSSDWMAALPLVALLAGIGLGWALNHFHHKRSGQSGSKSLARIDHNALTREEELERIHAGEVELAQLEVRLNYLNKAIAAARQQVDDSGQEHDHLLLALDERQASVKDAQTSLQSIRQMAETRHHEADALLTDINKSIEEFDLLRQMKDSYEVKINRLTQQVQWQDSELRMLRQTAKARSGEIDEAKALVDRREAELRLLIRQRQQREIDVSHARQMLAHRDDQLRETLGQATGIEGVAASPELPRLEGPARRVDVTPPERPPLLAAEPESDPLPAPRSAAPAIEDDFNEDLTVIPRLAEYYARQLKEKGVLTVRQLAGLTEDEVRGLLTIPGHHAPNIEGWLKAARKMTRNRRRFAGQEHQAGN